MITRRVIALHQGRVHDIASSASYRVIRRADIVQQSLADARFRSAAG
jgi:hypothetical protein